MDPYEVLGIKPTATVLEVRRAYRAAALRWHPDRAGGDAARFHAAAAAHEILRDPGRRAAYDASVLPRPALAPVALDLGNLPEGFRTTRTVVVRNAGAGEPELGLDRDSGTGWRVAAVSGSTAPGDGVEIVLEIDTSNVRRGEVDESLVITLGARAASLRIRYAVTAWQPAPGSWRPAPTSAGVVGGSPWASAGRSAIPGWGLVLGQPRWRLVAAAGLAGGVLPLVVLSGQHGSASGLALVVALSLASMAVAVAIRTEAFAPSRLEVLGTGDQLGVAAVSGVGAATAATFAIAVAIALIVAVLVIGALIAAMSDG